MLRLLIAVGFLLVAEPAWAQTGDGTARTGLIVLLVVALVFFLGIRPYLASAVELGLRRFFNSDDGKKLVAAIKNSNG